MISVRDIALSLTLAPAFIMAVPEKAPYIPPELMMSGEKPAAKDAAIKPEEGTAKVHYRVVLEPFRRTLLYSEVNRPVEKINFRMGDAFKEGDIIIQLDPVIFEANRLKAEAVLEKARTEFVAKQQLYNDHVASLFELKEAQAAVADAESELAVAKNNLAASSLKAPYDGKVVDLSIEERELPKTGMPLIELVNDHVLLARLLVPSSLLSKMKIGDILSIKLNETGEVVKGHISRIGSVIDPASSTIKIEAEIDNSDGRLKAGMTGLADFKGPYQYSDHMKQQE